MTNLTANIQIGDFIEITSWKTTGRVVSIEPAYYGEDSAIRVNIETSPEGNESHWYQIEDRQFNNWLQ